MWEECSSPSIAQTSHHSDGTSKTVHAYVECFSNAVPGTKAKNTFMYSASLYIEYFFDAVKKVNENPIISDCGI